MSIADLAVAAFVFGTSFGISLGSTLIAYNYFANRKSREAADAIVTALNEATTSMNWHRGDTN